MKNKNNTSSSDTRQKILDASELLFARDGYRGTSLRTITSEAGVNLASVNYHFGSKKTLLEEVIKRRILPLNQIRRKRLEEVRDTARMHGKIPDIKDILLAFIEPTLLFKESDPGAINFFTFIGRSFTDPDDTVRKTFFKYIKPMFQLLYQTTGEALPNLSKDIVFWRLQFSMGSLFHSMHVCGNISMKSLEFNTDVNAKTLINLIIPYVTAGMNAKG